MKNYVILALIAISSHAMAEDTGFINRMTPFMGEVSMKCSYLKSQLKDTEKEAAKIELVQNDEHTDLVISSAHNKITLSSVDISHDEKTITDKQTLVIDNFNVGENAYWNNLTTVESKSLLKKLVSKHDKKIEREDTNIIQFVDDNELSYEFIGGSGQIFCKIKK